MARCAGCFCTPILRLTVRNEKGSPAAQPADEPVRIMERYAAALAANDVEGLVSLYAANGVFIRDEMKPVVGREALRTAYKEVFATLKVSLAFTIQEVEAVGDIA